MEKYIIIIMKRDKMVLTFHVTKEIFQMYLHENKTHEYREYNEYWHTRSLKLKNGDNIAICEGYSSNLIHMYFVGCKGIQYNDLPEYAKKFFIPYQGILDFDLNHSQKG
jgi:tRNA(His) 5'-end guanylyltransferase